MALLIVRLEGFVVYRFSPPLPIDLERRCASDRLGPAHSKPVATEGRRDFVADRERRLFIGRRSRVVSS